MKFNAEQAVFSARLLAFALTLGVTALILFFAPTAVVRAAPKATNWIVTSSADGAANISNCPHISNCRLRDAIQAASDGDSISFSLTLPATITLTFGPLNVSDLTINGPGQNSLSISGNNAGFVFDTGGNTTITGLTIRDGNNLGSSGGGISSGGTLTLTNVKVISNTATSAGAIWNNSGELILTNVTIANNIAVVDGGGIYNNNSTSSMTMISSTVSGNIAGSGGGGIINGGAITLTNSTISSNQSSGGGGGVYNVGRLMLNGVTINGNKSVGSGTGGGGIYTSSSMTMTLDNVTISGNSSDPAGTGWGGGILSFNTPSNLNNVTLANNKTGSNGGGGVRTTGSNPFNFKNTIIAGNTSTGFAPDCDYGVAIISEDYNLMQVDCSPSGTTTHNITGQDPKLTPLAWLGGTTQTHGLLSGSPALNQIPAGTNGCGTTYTADQRGSARPMNGACDIGAFEGIASALYLPLIFR